MQSVMYEILMLCRRYTFVYLDDIVLHSETEKEHLKRLRTTVLNMLSLNDSYMNQRNANWEKMESIFLTTQLVKKG